MIDINSAMHHTPGTLASSQAKLSTACAAQQTRLVVCTLLLLTSISYTTCFIITMIGLSPGKIFELSSIYLAHNVQEPVPGIGPSPPEFDPPERSRPSPPVPEDDPMRPLPPQQPEIPPNERCVRCLEPSPLQSTQLYQKFGV